MSEHEENVPDELFESCPRCGAALLTHVVHNHENHMYCDDGERVTEETIDAHLRKLGYDVPEEDEP